MQYINANVLNPNSPESNDALGMVLHTRFETSASLQAIVTGSDTVGALQLQFSNDFINPTSWQDVGSAVQVAGDGVYALDPIKIAYEWMRTSYTSQSGTKQTITTVADVPGLKQISNVECNDDSFVPGVAEITNIQCVTGGIFSTGAHETTQITTVDDVSGSLNNTYFTIFSALNRNQYNFWFNVDHTGTPPGAGGFDVEVNINTNDSASTVANAIANIFNASFSSDFFATSPGGGATFTVTNTLVGITTPTADGVSTGFTISELLAGANPSTPYFLCNPAHDTPNFYVWYNIDGAGTDPAPGGVGIEVPIGYYDTEITQVSNTISAINANIPTYIVAATTPTGGVFMITNQQIGSATDANPVNTGFSIVVTQQGSDDSGVLNNKYFFVYSANDVQSYYVWYNVNGTGTNPGQPGFGIEVDLPLNSSAIQVASATIAAINAQAISDLLASAGAFGQEVEITNQSDGPSSATADGNTGFAFGTVRNGTKDSLSGKYFFIDSTSAQGSVEYYVWLDNFNGGSIDPGVNPGLPGKSPIPVQYHSGDSAATLASNLAGALNIVATTPFAATVINNIVTVRFTAKGTYVPAVDVDTGFTFAGNIPLNPGTLSVRLKTINRGLSRD